MTRATLETQSSKSGTRRPGKNSPQWQRMKGEKKPRAAIVSDATGEEESYHFIGYVPAYGKVWELDGLKPGPLEVGELPEYQASYQTGGASSTKGWMDVVRPALRMKMKKYGGSSKGDNIRFSLLALVDDQYQMANDDLEIVKRERRALERRLDDVDQHDWRSKVRKFWGWEYFPHSIDSRWSLKSQRSPPKSQLAQVHRSLLPLILGSVVWIRT